MASCEDLDYQFLSHLYECLAVAVDENRKRFSGRPSTGQFFLEVTNLSLQIKSEIFRYHGKQVKIQLYGSSVEDLNVDPIPDYDVMIFPTSDNLTIDDELIEYLPWNAMHVRIKGADHPLLQSCLVDNTGYVATSALKNFHPAIYEPNDMADSDIIHAAVMAGVMRNAFDVHVSLENSMTSPAVKFATSSVCKPYVQGTFTNELGDIQNKGEEKVPNLDSLVEIIPAFQSLAWPKVAQEWINRQRKWPLPEKVDKVIREGFHLVAKAPKSDAGHPEYDFIISFSHAEYLLSQEMNEIQRQCYRCLQIYHQVYLSTEPKGLISFHLKNIFLRTIEETGAEMWIESRRAECMSKLFANLLKALREKDLPHYFVRSYNLFDSDYIEDQAILESLTKKVERIMENPVKFAKELILITRGKLSSPVQEQDQSEVFLSSLKKENEDDSFANYSFYNHYNLMTSYLATIKETKELIEALNNVFCTLDDRDSLERTIVEDLRAKIRKVKSNIDELFSVTLEVLLQRELLVLCEIKKEIENGSFPNFSCIPHNMKKFYLATIKNVIEALNNRNCILEDLDPRERNIVEDLREMRKKNCKRNEDLFFLTSRAPFESGHFLWLLSGQSLNDKDIRCTVLASLKQFIEVAKNFYPVIVESAAEGKNVSHAILKHMVDPASEVPFDWNIILPPGLDEDKRKVCLEMAKLFYKELYDKVMTKIDDDIPLD